MQLAIRWGLVAAMAGMALGCSDGTAGGGLAPDGGAGNAGFGAFGGTGAFGGAGGSGGVGATGGGGTGGTVVTEDPPTAHPPPDPGGPPPGSSTVVALAVHRLFLGETDRQGQPDPNAWKSYGYDLDGHFSTKNSTEHCMPAKGANPASVKTDGNGGIDNSFGANLIPILKTLSSSPSESVTSDILSGNGTYLFRFAGLGAGPNQSPVASGFLGGAQYPGVPAWNGLDVWPITAESVNGSTSSPLVSLPSYVSNGTWVAHASGPLTVTVALQGFRWPIVIHQAIVTADVSGSGSSMLGQNGNLAGVLLTDELIAGFQKVAGALDANLCDGATFESIAQQIRAASDIMGDGSNGDSSATCNGISIGIGFESIAAGIGAVAPPEPPVGDPCLN